MIYSERSLLLFLSLGGASDSEAVEEVAVVIVVGVSVLLMFLGGIFIFLENPLQTGAEDQDELTSSAWVDFTGRIIFWLGAAVMAAMLIIGGVLMKDVDPAVRFGMLFLAGLMLIGTGLAI